MVALAYKMYELQLKYLEDILHMNWCGENSKLAILGGIMINCDGDGTDMFVPLKFEIRTTTDKKDIFKQAFGHDVVAPHLETPEGATLDPEA